MKIYQNRVEIDNFPLFRKNKPGEWLTHLTGIHLSVQDNVVVEPIYMPLVRFEKIGNVLLVSFATGRPLVDLWLSLRKPFIQIEKSTHFVLEDYDNSDY